MMIDGIGWIEQCLRKLPPRRQILRLDPSFIRYDASSKRGIIRFQILRKPDTIVCHNVFANIRDSKSICYHAYDILEPDGIIIIVCTNIHPGLIRFCLKRFQWKFITVIPEAGELYAIAGKGERPYELAMTERV